MFQLGVSRIQKAEWLKAYYPAHDQGFSVENIKSCFSGTGIHPFNPDKAFNHLPAKQQNPPSTPSMTVFPQTLMTVTTMSTTPFSAQVLMSSPSDFTILQAVNSTLNQMIESVQPLPTPARKVVRCLTTTAEKLYTRTSILQEHTEAQATLLAARQE
jgi:hypothetical protein